MRVFVGGSELIVPARWYYAPAGASTQFGPRGGEASPWFKTFETNFGFGEVTGGPISYWPGTNPGYQGHAYCGEREWFVDGRLPANILDGPPPAICDGCQGPVAYGTGALELAGSAVAPPPGAGGIELAGQAQVVPTGTGGLELAGRVPFRPVGTGGLELAGRVPFRPVGTGGLELAGLASIPSPSPSGSGGAFPESCRFCPDGAAVQYKFRLHGLTNSTTPLCTGCVALNDRDIVVTFTGECQWEGNDNPCAGTGDNPFLEITASTVTVTFLDAFVKYSAARGAWDCKSPIVLNFGTVGTPGCANWPATITLEPV